MAQPLRPALWLAVLVFTPATLGAAEPQRPNVLLIVADDMGYSDAGCYGGEIRTPNLDALANNGLRFTQFYNTARCCPTRAALLTGLYPHQAGVGHMMDDKGDKYPGYRGDLNKNCVTLAEAVCGSSITPRRMGVGPGGRSVLTGCGPSMMLQP